MLDLINKFVGQRLGRTPAKRKPARLQNRRRLGFEALEDRCLLTGTTVSGAIAAIQVNQGTQTDIFAIGTDSQVYMETSNGVGGWNAWKLTQAGTVKEIAVAHDGAGNVHLFAIRDDNQVWEEDLVNGAWTGWTMTHAGYAQDIATQATVVPGTALQVFIIGSDQQVYSESANSGGGWSNWTLTHAGTAKQISAMMDSIGETHIFAIGTDNQVWTEHSVGVGAWSIWTLTQPGTVQEITTPTATTSQSPLKVLAVGDDGQVYLETSANNWKGWTLTQPGTVKGISAVNNSSGTTSVYSVGADQQVYFETANNPWTVWKLTAAGTFLGADVVITPSPALSIGGSAVTYNPGGAPIGIASAATLTTGDGQFANSSLTVTDTSPYVNDRLGIRSSGALVVSGKSLIFNGTTVGSITTNGNRTLTFTFNADATQAAILAVVQNITFTNIVAKPMIANRPVSFDLKVGSLGYLVTTTQTVDLIPPTVLTVGNPAPTYNSGGARIVVAPTATLTTGDGQFANSSLTVADTSPYVNDRLGIRSSGGLVVSGKSLIFDGITIGSITTNGNRTLTFTFNGNATQAGILAVVENITFSNVVANPMVGKRPISFRLRVGSAGYVVTATETVQVAA